MKEPFDIRQLRAFATLARTGSFTQTARELHISQSAISHAMKALERDAGCRLLDKLGKRVTLTQAGEQLLHYAEKILQDLASARNSLEELGKWGKGRVRIGASDTACQHILPGVLREFKEGYPQCAIVIEPGDTPELIELLMEKRVDVAVGLEPDREPRIEFQPLFTDELMFLVGADHPWHTKGHVVREEIPKQQYILYSKQSFTFQHIEDFFREEEMVLNTVVELGNMEAIKELVKLGLGVSIAAPWIAREELESGELVSLPLGKRKLKRNWGFMALKNRRLNLMEETLLGFCKSAAQALPLGEAGASN